MGDEQLLSCPYCFSHNRPVARFCQQCGRFLAGAAVAETGDAAPPADRETLPLPLPETGVRLYLGFASHPGQARVLNEDSLIMITVDGLFDTAHRLAMGFYAVADGLGGHQAGEVASREAVRWLGANVLGRVLERILTTGRSMSSQRMAEVLTETLSRVNEDLYQLRRRHANDMGATVTVALIVGQQAVIANVGDSRTYLWRNGSLEQKTEDHSLVARLVASGVEDQASLYNREHEQKGIIYRCLGNQAEVHVDTVPLALEPGDRLLLCCDGVWEMAHDDALARILRDHPQPQQACEAIIQMANQAGGEDNMSVIVIAVEAVSH